MSKAGKSLIWVVVAVVVILAIVAVVVLSNLDRIVKNGVESYGSAATGVPVSVGSVDVSARSGSGTMQGLKIANPSGFDSDHAFQLGSIDLRLDTQSLTSDTIVIKELTVDSAHLTAEYKGMNESNLGVISDHLEDYAGTAPEGQAPGTRIVINKFRVSNGELRVVHKQLGIDRTVSFPELAIDGIGTRGAGATIAEAARRMLQPIVSSALAAARDEALQRGREQLDGEIRKGVENLLGGDDEDSGEN